MLVNIFTSAYGGVTAKIDEVKAREALKEAGWKPVEQKEKWKPVVLRRRAGQEEVRV